MRNDHFVLTSPCTSSGLSSIVLEALLKTNRSTMLPPQVAGAPGVSNDQHTASMALATLLIIPRELRDEVYELLLKEEDWIQLHPRPKKKSRTPPRHQALSNYRQLALTCRQLQSEAEFFFLGKNWFGIDVGTLIVRVPDQQVDLMKHIIFMDYKLVPWTAELWCSVQIGRREGASDVHVSIKRQNTWWKLNELRSAGVSQPDQDIENMILQLEKAAKPTVQMLQEYLDDGLKLNRKLLEEVSDKLERQWD